MAYEIYERKVVRAGSPAISISAGGRMSFNKIASEIMEKEAFDFVLLLWDKEHRKMAIRPITKKDSRSYRIHYSKRRNGAGFHAKTFLDYVGYTHGTGGTKAIPATWNQVDNIFEAEIPAEFLRESRQTRLPIQMDEVREMKKTSKQA